MRQRRFLPSLSQLIAFEAVMRHGSVTAAADELHLTQSTVSRLVASLERQLGKPLFTRDRKRLTPTPEAVTYAASVTQGLDVIQRASMGLIANPGGGVLSLSVLPTFATRWLAPRIGQFLSDNPGISINLSTKIQRFSFASEAFDAVIFFGQPDWPDAHHLRLFDERLTACASPQMLAHHPVAHPSDMAGLPLLQLETRPSGWSAWFAAQGGTPPAVSGHGDGPVLDDDPGGDRGAWRGAAAQLSGPARDRRGPPAADPARRRSRRGRLLAGMARPPSG